MRRYHWVRLYALLLMIVLFATAMLVTARSAFSMFQKASRQKSIVRSVQGISSASDAIIDRVSAIAKTAGEEQYVQLQELVTVEDDSHLSEKDLEGYFRLGYSNKIKASLGEEGEALCDNLNRFITEAGLSRVSVAYSPDTRVADECDDSQNVTALWIRNVNIVYDDPVIGDRTDTINFQVIFPDAVFHAGNDELFRYCMVARKGLYMSGRTSSIIGDVFAGDHLPEECREAEVAYGETGTYGGINILSTQVGMKSDRIVSMGDINVNGSFVVMSPGNDRLDVYAQRMNRIEGFSKKSQFTLEGDYHSTYRMDEGPLDEYYDAIRLVDTSLSGLGEISTYYDSNNDRMYAGRYRKLITNSDVELKSDFTGIVATPGNVIIHNDVNFEGIILCGDRIYAMGNNNIVANAVVARAVIASENNEEYGIKVMNYIGGMKAAKLTPPEHYVVPYK